MNQNTLYKQTEIGDLSAHDTGMQAEILDDWNPTSLGEIVNLNYGKSLPERNRIDGDVPVYGSSGITGYHNKPLIEEEGYIIGRKGTIGSVYYSKTPFYPIDTTYFATKSDIKCDFNFFYYLVKSLRLDELNSDSAVPGLNRERAYSQRFFLPNTKEEQQQIASILSSLDDKIELNRRINKTLEEIGKALFRQLFEQKNSSTSELNEIVDFNPRETLDKSTKARFIEMKDLPEESMWVSSNVFKPYKGGSKFRNGDSLMARITPCLENGKSGFVNSLSEGELAFGSTEFIVFRPKKEIYKEFVYYLVRDEEFRDHAIKSMVGSSGRQRVQIDAIRTYEINIPSEKVIEVFHALASGIFEQIKQKSVENEKLAELRDALLPRLMSGRLRV